MPSTIYNEGRVVGFSAYEIYVRHALCEDPETPPASELEWLSSNLATGSSMLLKISADPTKSGHHILNIPLPANSNLAAANTIIGSLFLGTAAVDANGWATKVTSYGPLLTNDANHPAPGDHSSNTDEEPITLNTPLSAEQQSQILNYIQVIDGIVIQPGTWSSTHSASPYNDFSPDLSKPPYLKLYISDKITNDFYILLTGFTLRTVLAGISGLNGSTDTSTNFYRNGGFLGPAVFPWANKIVFSVPPAYAAYFLNAKYTRRMSLNGDPSSLEPAAKNVRRISVVDMETTDPATYYETSDSDSRVPLTVNGLNKTNGDAVLTVYQRNAAFPPALFGTKVDASGAHHAHPIDTVAPGTVKFFDGEDRSELADKSILFEDKVPNNHALFRDSNDYVVRQINHSISSDPDDWIDTPVADTYAASLYGALESSDVTPPYFVIQTNAGDPSGFAATSTLCNRRVRGKVSDQFRQDFGIDPATPEGYGFLELLTQKINNSYDHGQGAVYDSQINTSMLDYISSISDWKSKYFFIVQASSPSGSGTSVVSRLSLVPVAKPDANDVAPSNTFDYIYKSYGPSFKIPIILPTSTDEANRSGSFGQYVGGYYNNEGPTSHDTILEYLQTVLAINPVALMDGSRRVPQIDGYTNWQDAYADITVKELVTAVRNDAVSRSAISSSITVDTILNGGFQYTYTDTHGNSRTTTYQKINSQYWDMPISEALEITRFYDATTGDLLDGNIQKLNYIYIDNLQLTINNASVNYSNYIDTLGNIPDWSDNEDLRFELTTSQPTDWETSWKRYYTRRISTSTQRPKYDKLTSNSAPAWDYNTYYIQKYEFTAVNYSQSLTLTTVVQQNAPKFVAMQWPTAEAQDKYSFKNGPLSAITTTGLHQTKSLSVADSEGKIYDMSGESGTIPNLKDGNIHWDDLLNALVNNKAIDVLGSPRFKSEFLRIFGEAVTNGIGISIIWDETNNRYMITNTQPYNPSGQGYTRLYQANAEEQQAETVKRHGGFKAISYNGWRSCDEGHLKWWGDGTYNANTGSPYADNSSEPYLDAHINTPAQLVPRVRVDILPAMHLTYRKIVCPVAPADWDDCWKYYYYELQITEDATTYKDLVTIYKSLLTSEPDDWGSNYFDYYTYDEDLDKCISVPAGSSAPQWEEDVYYTAEKPSWQGDTFSLLTSKPDDWDTYDWDTNNKYYIRIQSSPLRYALVPKGFEHQWAPSTYYTKTDTAKFYVGYPDTVSTNLSGASSYTPTSLVSSSGGPTYSYSLGMPPKLPYTGSNQGSISRGFTESDGFTFKHADTITSASGLRSAIVGIKFTGKYAFLNHTRDMTSHSGIVVNDYSRVSAQAQPSNWPAGYYKKDGSDYVPATSSDTYSANTYYELTGQHVKPNPRLVYTFAGTTSGTTGIWNMRRLGSVHYEDNSKTISNLQSFDRYHDLAGTYVQAGGQPSWTRSNVGAAWSAMCNVYEGLSNGFTDCTFLVSGAAYADGYNEQMYNWSAFYPEGVPADKGKDMMVFYTNLNISSLFYL